MRSLRHQSDLAQPCDGSAPCCRSRAASVPPWCCACSGSDRVAGKLPRVILASTSPRRIEILKRSGIPFEVVPPGIDERPPAPLGPLRFVAWAAEAKASAVARRVPGAVVVAADTEVVRHRRIYGKPGDRR